MNTISESLIKSVDIVVNNTISKMKFDTTITAEIKKIVNLNTGEYKVEYNGNLFSVYSQNPDIIYEIGQKVYVKIPEGDYSKKKFIEISADDDFKPGLVDNENENSQDINLLEPDFILYNGEEIGLIAGVEPLIKDININPIFDNQLFKDYNNFYNKIQVSALFRTNFRNKPIKGDYGLKIIFILADGKEQEYIFNLSSFSGDPYAFINDSFQKLQLNIELKTLAGIKKISFFQNNFDKDYKIIYDSLGQPEKEYNETEYNLFVKDIKINYFELVDYTKTKYYLSLLTPQGNSFINNDRQELTLKGILKYYGKKVDSKDCEYFWYKENYSITQSNENYNIMAGPGWELIPNESKEEYIIEKNSYIDNRKFKLIVLYNKNTVISKEIQIFFKEDRFEIQRNGASQLLLFDKIEQKQYNNSVIWYYSLPNGLYDIINTTNEAIDISSYLIHDFITFYAEVYDENNNIISYESKIIEKELDNSSVNVSFLGNSVYHYDSNGQPTFIQPEKNKTLNFHINSDSQFKITWLINDVAIGKSEGINPDNSMIQNLLVSADGLTLNYNVKNSFNGSFTNNTITLKLESVNGDSYLFYKDLLFLKDGDQGTNGTDYVCITTFWDYINNKKLDGFHSISLGETFYLKTDIYQNGNLVDDKLIDCEYKELDQNCINKISQSGNICSFKIVDQLPADNYNFIIKINVKISGITIYNNFPIPIKIGIIDNLKINTNIPSYIRYNAQGTNPQVINNDIIFSYNGTDCIDKIIPLDENILSIKDKKLKPTPYYNIVENSPAILKLYIDDNNYILYPVVMYVDTFGNQSINDWDGTAIEINEENNAIFAPMIGAGEKNNQTNQFTGVLMGKYIYTDLNSSKKIENGLFGFKEGQGSFGFRSDGSAFIGLPGEGQIVFEGGKGIIQSGNYTETTGMKIDLSDGIITAYNFALDSNALKIKNNRFEFDLDKGQTENITTSSTFVIKNDTKNLFYINAKDTEDNRFYLQSNNYGDSGEKGLKIDLEKGSIDIQKGKINIGDNFIVDESGKVTIKTVSEDDDSVFAKINTAIEGKSGKISLEVNNGSTSSSITLKENGVSINSEDITFSGFVTFTGLSGGTTSIDGACIKTGTISANRLNLSGSISFNDLTSSVQQRITDTEEAIGIWKYGDTTYIDGNQIYAGTVTAGKLQSKEVGLYNEFGVYVGSFTFSTSSSAERGEGIKIEGPAIGLYATEGDVYLKSGGAAYMQIQEAGSIFCNGPFYPTNNGYWNLGRSDNKWHTVYALTSTINTSDKNEKTDITYGLDKYSTLFDSLRPCSFKFINGKRTHIGMIAQDVEEEMIANNISDMDFATFIKSPKEEGGYIYGLRYTELIPLLIEQVQKLKKRVKQLETE